MFPDATLCIIARHTTHAVVVLTKPANVARELAFGLPTVAAVILLSIVTFNLAVEESASADFYDLENTVCDFCNTRRLEQDEAHTEALRRLTGGAYDRD